MNPFNWTVIEPEKDQVFNQLQSELKIWQAHNFPNRQSFEPLLGIIEELGELEEAKNEEDQSDAIGDCLVYMMDYCNSMNITIKDLALNPYETTNCDIRVILGKLSHAHLKLHQKIRMTEDHIGNIRESLNAIYYYLGDRINNFDLETIVWQVWLKVRERDWQANRNEAHKI